MSIKIANQFPCVLVKKMLEGNSSAIPHFYSQGRTVAGTISAPALGLSTDHGKQDDRYDDKFF